MLVRLREKKAQEARCLEDLLPCNACISLVCCTVRHCHINYNNSTILLYSPADVLGGRDDTS